LMNCAATKPGKGYVDNTPDEIQKLIDKKYKQSMTAVGTATSGEENTATSKATVQARAEIARVFKAQIDVLQKLYEESVNNRELGEYKQAVEIFASLELNGSEIAKSMVRKEKKGYSAKVLVVVSAEQLKKMLEERMAAITSFKASKAYKELEDRVAKENQAAQEAEKEMQNP
jgi:hypothetical protein